MRRNEWRNGLGVGLFLGIAAAVLLSLATISFVDLLKCEPCHTAEADYKGDSNKNIPQRGWPTVLQNLAPDRPSPAPPPIVFSDSLPQWIISILTIFAFFVLILTLRTNRKMTNDAREIGLAQTRAYLSRVRGGVWEGIGLEAEIDIQNSGNSPALMVGFLIELVHFRDIGQGVRQEEYTYTLPYFVGDIGANTIIDTGRIHHLGLHSLNGISSFTMESANIGIFATDVFGAPVEFFGGLGNFADATSYGAAKDDRRQTAPLGTRGCEGRLRSTWLKLRDTHQQY